MSSGSPVESVRRAFALLEELNRQRINSVQHLHEATDWTSHDETGPRCHLI
jgi:IclR family transcriptional regulator, mhp operon transcriptional activator